MGQTANCCCWKCLFVGRLTTLTEARKEKNSYFRLFQLSLEKEMLKEGMWFESRTVVPEPFVSFSHSSLQINPRWLWDGIWETRTSRISSLRRLFDCAHASSYS